MGLPHAQAAILDAVVACLIPSDENGPGAREANVIRYIELALEGDYQAHLPAYLDGLEAIDEHARSAHGSPLVELGAPEQIGVLADVEQGRVSEVAASFFELLRQHVLEGMFGDPGWGGNADLVGWKLLGYPGPRFEWTEDDQRLDVVVEPKHEGTAPRSAPAAEPLPQASRSGPPAPADVVLVGLGAACGIAADVLTAAGLDVVALEAGPRLDASMMTLDEIRNDLRAWLAQPKAMHEMPTWRQTPSDPSGPPPWPILMANAVGGSTVHYAALSARFHPWNFRSRTSTIERYGAGAIPEGSTVDDWPLDYEELEPFYDQVERAIGVAGAAGKVGSESLSGGSQFEGPRSRGYPLAPLRRTGWTELMAGAAGGLGWHPFPAPAAINSEPYNGNPECTYCGFCVNNGCYRDAKGSVDATVIRRAEATGLLRVETGARVVRIDVDSEGLARGVTFVQDGRERFQPGRVVLVGTFTYENVRLLLLSASKAYPHGLSNNHGQVGKHYMAHITPDVFGLFPGRRLNVFNGTWTQSTCVDDWNADNFDHTGLGFIGGGLLSAPHEHKPITSAARAVPPWVPRWGAPWKAWLKEHGESFANVNAQMEGLSYEDSTLDLDPAAKDPYGLPVVRVTHRVRENEERGCAFLSEKLETWLLEAGASETWSVPIPVEARHCKGGTRMGNDPDSSVVDRHGFSHEVPNLGVLGASTFPTTGGHNPTLTVQALAWRTAQHLVDEWSSIAAGSG